MQRGQLGSASLRAGARRAFLFCAWCLFTLTFCTLSAAENRTVSVSGPALLLSDLLPTAPQGLARLEIGNAPPPGRSRTFTLDEIATRLRARGVAASTLKLPAQIIVSTRARTFSRDELESLVDEPVRAALPSGISLDSIRVSRGRLLPPGIHVGQVRLPRFVPREGQQLQTGTVEILWGQKVLQRLVVQMSVTVSTAVAAQHVKRGSSVTLSIRRGAVQISALAQTLSASSVGESVSVRVGVTKKVLTARLVSPSRAELELL